MTLCKWCGNDVPSPCLVRQNTVQCPNLSSAAETSVTSAARDLVHNASSVIHGDAVGNKFRMVWANDFNALELSLQDGGKS